MSSDAPAVPENVAVPTINKNRLMRFSRPFVPGNKKNSTPAVPPRKWHPDDNEQQAEGEKHFDRDAPFASVRSTVTSKAVEELFTSKLNQQEEERALAGHEPILTTSNEAAGIRAKRFGGDAAASTAATAESKDQRSARFGTSGATEESSAIATSGKIELPSELVQTRANRFGLVATTSSAAAASSSSSSVVVDTAVMTEAEKKRMSRWA